MSHYKVLSCQLQIAANDEDKKKMIQLIFSKHQDKITAAVQMDLVRFAHMLEGLQIINQHTAQDAHGIPGKGPYELAAHILRAVRNKVESYPQYFPKLVQCLENFDADLSRDLMLHWNSSKQLSICFSASQRACIHMFSITHPLAFSLFFFRALGTELTLVSGSRSEALFRKNVFLYAQQIELIFLVFVFCFPSVSFSSFVCFCTAILCPLVAVNHVLKFICEL